MRVTFDTNILPADDLVRLANDSYEFAVVSVTAREVEGTSFEIHLKPLGGIPETAVWDESRWDEAVLADGDDNTLERVLKVVSSGAFPKAGFRDSLTDKQKTQLRDAMVFAAHVREARDVFVTIDGRAFINHGKRAALQADFGTTIMTREEFRRLLENPSGAI